MRVVVAVTELHVHPELVGRRRLDDVLGVEENRWSCDIPLVAGKEENVGARTVHLVRLSRMDRFLLHRLDAERLQLLVKHLTEIHHHRLVDLLPQVSAEDLDQGDLQRRDLAVQEDPRQVQLDLEADVDVGSVDRWRPPQSEATVRDLIEAGPLRVRELLELHRLFKSGCLLPKEALPRRKGSRLEQRVLEDRLHTPEGLDDVGSVGVEVPQLPIVSLTRPPEWIALHQLVRLELRPSPEAFVETQRAPVLLEEGVDSRQASIPAVFQILEGQPSILLVGLLTLLRVLRPDSL